MNGRGCRDKGKRAEREVIGLLQPVVNQVYAVYEREPPLLQRNTLQCDSGGEDIAGLPDLAIEVKHQETFAVAAWWKQACEQARKKNLIPVLIYKKNNSPWTVRLYVRLHGREIPANVSMMDFLEWFRYLLVRSLEK